MKRTLAVILSILMIVVTITSGNILSVSAATLSTNEELNDVNNWVAITGSNAIYPSTGDVWLRPMADTELKGGNSVSTIKFTGVNAYTYATKLSVEKNKNYTLSFDYYSENLYNWDANRQVVYNTVGVAPLKEGSLIYRSSTTATPAALSTVCAGGYFKGAYSSGMAYDDPSINTVVTKTDNNWYSLTFEFNSAENEEVEFFLLTTALGANTSTEIANVKLEETVETVKVTTDEELNDVNNWSAITSSGGIYPVGSAWLSPAADTEVKGDATLKTIKVTGVGSYAYAIKLNVEKNKSYKISFDYFSENLYNWDANRQVVYNTVGVAPLKEGSLIYRSSTTATPAGLSTVCAGGYFKGAYSSGMAYDDPSLNTVVTKTDDNWYSLAFEFNSAENEEVEFFLLTTALGASTSTEIANIKLVDLSKVVNVTTNKELNDVNSWTAITSSGGNYPVGSAWLSPAADTEAKDGATVNTIKFTGANAYTYATKLNVEKNKNYIISFDYYSENLYNWDANRKVVYDTIGVAPLKEGNLIYRSTTTANPIALSTVCAGGLFKGAYYSGITYDDLLINTVVTETDDNWYSLTFEFNSAENEEVEFFILTTALGSSATTEIANVKLVEDDHIYYSAKLLSEHEKYFNTLGSTPYESETESFNLPFIGSGFEFVTGGNDLVLNIKSAYLAQYNEYYTDKDAVTKGHTLRFKVWIDGVQQDDVIINERYYGFKKVAFASNMGEGDHTVKIVRASEATVCREFYVNEVSSNGELRVVNKSDKPYIEVYGDSISSGYGNIADGEYLNFNKNSDNYAYVKDGYLVDETTEGAIKVATRSEYDFEDGTKTYAYLAAENIGADIGVFSKSGLGITVYGGKAEEDTETMSKWYPNLPVNNDADYVIINHITNDIAHYSTAAGLTLEGLADAYAEFITTVRKDHINAKIIVAYGMMSIPTTAADSEKVILDAVAKVKASDDAVYAIKLPTGLDGGGAHPTEEQHLKASELLTEFINGLDVIKTENCAGIRAKSDNLKQGIRVKNAISIAEIENKNIVTYGAVAIKKSNLKIDEALTLSSEKGVVGIAYNTNEDNGYKVVSEPILREYTDTENIYSAVLINIKNRYFADSYLVRSFAIDANGSVYYGEVTEVSVFAVVYSILEGENAEDISTANSIVDEIITADATDTAGVITTYAEWCAVNGVVDNSASANK